MDAPQIITQKYLNALTYKIIGAAIEVHKHLGPGLLEKVYEIALLHELKLRGLKATSQENVLINYKGITLDCKLRFDILVEDLIIVEAKAVQEMLPVFECQLLTYMKHRKIPKGILLNFTTKHLYRHGCQTMVNEYFAALPNE